MRVSWLRLVGGRTRSCSRTEPRRVVPTAPARRNRRAAGVTAAPARLAAHLRAVHDVAWQLTEQLNASFPALAFDRDAALYGAATHDIGKVEHPDELTGPGHQHELTGYRLLTAHGVPVRLARFARTHASWTDPDTGIDDHLVSLADKIWKAKRVPNLEDLVTAHLATVCGIEQWHSFAQLDDILDGLAADADHRLAARRVVRM